MLMTVAAGLMLVAEAKVRVREVTLADLVQGTGQAGRQVVLRLPVGQRQVTLPAATVAAMVRRATGMQVGGSGTVAITFLAPAPVRRDWTPEPALPRGSELTLRSVAGPVAIERPVTTLQPGRSGRSVFVRDGQGQVFAAPLAIGDDLYRPGGWGALATDQRATQVGDALTIVVYQSADASNSAQNATRKATDLSASIDAGSVSEGGRATLGGSFTGRGEARRSERLVTRLSATVSAVLPNGDLIVTGRQRMAINGERTEVGVRGRIRVADIGPDNSVLSSRIADAEIDYGGRGFVSRGSRPGLLNRLFGALGLG